MRRAARFGIIAAAASLFAAMPALAQSASDLAPEMIDQLTKVTRENLTRARLADGTNIPPETPEERAQPIAPRALELQTIDRGLLSARLRMCGEEYVATSYMPYMTKLRDSGRYSGKQLAYLGMLHGLTVGALSKPPEGKVPDCSEAVLAELHARAATLDGIEMP